MKKIAIQGVEVCFHHAAISKYFGTSRHDLFECLTFKRLAKVVTRSEVDARDMAIENLIAGTILLNYVLLSRYALEITGEIHMPIHHQLMALPEQTLVGIPEVFSPPVALLQCEEFFDRYFKIKVSEPDTSGAAQYIANNPFKEAVTIAPKSAARICSLKILVTDDMISNNFTRFFIIKACDQESPEKDFDKASLSFKSLHTTDSLSEALRIIAKLDINMSKIQSIPIMEKPWKYAFFIDLTFKGLEDYREMKRQISEKTQEILILGEYKSGRDL